LPATDLKALREYVANVLDYDPSNTTYSRQVDDLINEADRAICSSKPFTFINKATDITAYKDRSESITFTNGATLITTAGAFFESWMVNQEVEVGDETYTILSVVSGTDAHLERNFTGSTGAQTVSVINRYLDLPGDCTTILGVARRTNTRTPNSPGMLSPLTRYEDEWNNLPLGETNLPTFWVFADPVYLEAPRVNFTTSFSAAVGAGQRTCEFTSTFIRGGRESPHGQIVSVQAANDKHIVITPLSSPVATGLYKRYYFRCTEYGYNAWRLLEEPAGTPFEVTPSSTAAVTLQRYTVTELTTSESIYQDTRMAYPDGFTQRIRLYPRQDKDYVFTIRYMQAHQPMREDSDVSAIPPDQRMIIAYKALADVLIKHDNPVQAELYRKRYDAMLLKLEKRYLITPSRRIVKGNWLSNMEPNSYSRFSTLVHT
jgi:hypothetical protein